MQRFAAYFSTFCILASLYRIRAFLSQFGLQAEYNERCMKWGFSPQILIMLRSPPPREEERVISISAVNFDLIKTAAVCLPLQFADNQPVGFLNLCFFDCRASFVRNDRSSGNTFHPAFIFHSVYGQPIYIFVLKLCRRWSWYQVVSPASPDKYFIQNWQEISCFFHRLFTR